MLIQLAKTETFNALLKAEKAIIKFSAKWCGPCRQITPEFEALSKQHPLVAFVEIDTDQFPELTEQFDVQGLPTFISLKRGMTQNRVVGADKAKLRQMISLL